MRGRSRTARTVGETSIFGGIPRVPHPRGILALVMAMIVVAAGVTFIVGLTSRRVVDQAQGAGRLPRGTLICGLDFGGLSREEAVARLQAVAARLESEPVALSHENQVWLFDPRTVEMRVLVEATVDKAIVSTRRRPGRPFRPQPPSGRNGVTHDQVVETPPILIGDTGALQQYLSVLAAQINHPPRNATIRVDQEDRVHLIQSAPGHSLDRGTALANLLRALGSTTERDIQLSVTEIEPDIKTADVEAMGIKEPVSSFATSLSTLAEDRVHNIELAIKAIDGRTIAPGEEFSFNRVVGPRSRETGYKDAPVVLNAELVPGIGGGICQVSSTLYNAALLANLDITARTPHSIAPAYVPPGRDATVAYDYLDLRFRNNLPSHIMIVAGLDGRRLTIKLFGVKPVGQETSIHVKVEEKIPPGVVEKQDSSLEPGEREVEDDGSPGYVVSVWRLVKKGEATYRELVSRDRYDPRPALVRVNKRLDQDVTPAPTMTRSTGD